MADPWPSTLPDTFEVSSYSEQSMDNTISTKPEGGSLIVRKRFTASPREVSGTMILTGSQRNDLEAFYKLYCAERWLWQDVRGSPRYYNFSQPPKYSVWGGTYYKASLQLLEYTTEFGGG